MENFISCDWGTSAFRLKLIEAGTQNVLAEVKTQDGIAAAYASWKNNETTDRSSFYLDILSAHIKTLETQYGQSLENITIVISGMASSSIGMLELPYKELPFKTDGSDLLMHTVEPGNNFKHKILMVSGVRSANDVMRGEETILAGCNANNGDKETIFILPGTHSKHVTVKNGIVQEFKTYMTGEIFDLLSGKSILSASVQKSESVVNENEIDPNFIKGVTEGAATNLLNSIFHVRTNQLFQQMNKQENYHYLSGLLIGAELKDILKTNYSSVILVSTGSLYQLYAKALQAIGINNVQYQNADLALICGQSIIVEQYK